MTQCEQIKQHLIAGNTLTSYQAFVYFKITRLSDRIRDLRKKGLTVYAEMIRTKGGARVARYSL